MCGWRVAGAASLLLLVLTDSIFAQVHRCESAGRTTYSDQPCEAGATAKALPPIDPGPKGGLDLRVTVRHYEVRGNDRASLHRSLKERGPQGYHGFAQWNVRYRYTTQRRGASCQIDWVQLTVEGDILMPRWSNEAQGTPELRQAWTNYYHALKRHEDGHIEHGRELALLVRERLLGLGTRPCEQMSGLARDAFNQLYNNFKSRDKDYDARTGHGVNQGVRL
jgi:predicted secreted Zn-dependent protease